jgi:hypothetical protein
MRATTGWKPYVLGVATPFGVALGLPELPLAPLPELPPMFGQSPLMSPEPRPGRVDGAVVPPLPDGCWVALGAEDALGSGLAAITAATPPTPSSPIARTAVSIPRRTPVTVLAAGGGCTGWSSQSMLLISCCGEVDEITTG